MSDSFASERRALGVCDRCGLSYDLKELRYETVNLHPNHLRVCSQCWDKDHPQLQLGRYRVDDPQALRNPRIDTGEVGSTSPGGWFPIQGAHGVSNIGKVRIEIG